VHLSAAVSFSYMPSPKVINTSARTVNGRNTRSSSSTSNDDLMQIILSLKPEVLVSSKALFTSQSSQFKSFKAEIMKVSKQASELKEENAILKEEIGTLKLKINSLEESSSSLTHLQLPTGFCKNSLNVTAVPPTSLLMVC